MSLSQPKVCVVGSSMVDLIARVPRVPVAGETLVGSAFHIGFGGKGSNQAVMAARLGAQVRVVVKLGRDVFGENTLQNYRDEGIDTTHVLFDEEHFSGVAPITVIDNTGGNSIIIIPGANDNLSPEDVQRAAPLISEASVLICQLEIPIASTLEAFRIAKRGDVCTILNPAPAAELPDELLQLTDVLVPNETEAAALTGLAVSNDEEALTAAKDLQKRGPRIVIVTLGERGALVLEGDGGAEQVAAEAVKAVDTTGAGDAFVGSLAYFMASGYPVKEAVRRACIIATCSVLKKGTQSSFPYRQDVLSLTNL